MVTYLAYFTAFGERLDAGFRTAYTFAGDWGYRDDGDAGLLHVGARYYNPQVGRFLTVDEELEEHPYLYCDHDPVNFVDADGAQKKPVKPSKPGKPSKNPPDNEAEKKPNPGGNKPEKPKDPDKDKTPKPAPPAPQPPKRNEPPWWAPHIKIKCKIKVRFAEIDLDIEWPPRDREKQ